MLKTESIKEDIVEFTFELNDKKVSEEVLEWKNKKGIKNINLININ